MVSTPFRLPYLKRLGNANGISIRKCLPKSAPATQQAAPNTPPVVEPDLNVESNEDKLLRLRREERKRCIPPTPNSLKSWVRKPMR